MEPLHCRRVDLSRAGLPPGAPLDPVSLAHVRGCERCQTAIRTDALVSESLVRSASKRAHLPDAARSRLDQTITASLHGERRAARIVWARPYLAAAAVVLLSVALGTQLSGVVAAPTASAKAPGGSDAPPLLEALVARHGAHDVDPSATPLPEGVVFATRLPTPLAIGLAGAPKTRAVPSVACPWSGDEGDSTLFVLDRRKVEVDTGLADALARDGAVSVVLAEARVTVAERDTRLFVTVTSLPPRQEVAGRLF